MDEYIELLILSYFREYKEEYSLTDLKENLGVSFSMLDEFLGQLITEKKLIYSDNMLQLTEKGLIVLLTSRMKNYYFQSQKEYEIQQGDQSQIGKIRGFSKKKWRGNR